MTDLAAIWQTSGSQCRLIGIQIPDHFYLRVWQRFALCEHSLVFFCFGVYFVCFLYISSWLCEFCCYYQCSWLQLPEKICLQNDLPMWKINPCSLTHCIGFFVSIVTWKREWGREIYLLIHKQAKLWQVAACSCFCVFFLYACLVFTRWIKMSKNQTHRAGL